MLGGSEANLELEGDALNALGYYRVKEGRQSMSVMAMLRQQPSTPTVHRVHGGGA